jgi:hypothetical protein
MKAYEGEDILDGISSKIILMKIQTYRPTYMKDVYIKKCLKRKPLHLCAVESLIFPPAFLMSFNTFSPLDLQSIIQPILLLAGRRQA